LPPTAFLHKDIEGLDRASLEALQFAKLGDVLSRANSSPFYESRFEACGFEPGALTALSQVEDLPFTTKEDLRGSAYPYGFLTVTPDRLVRMHSSSGTTGRATVIFHTKTDLTCWAGLVARSMYMVGVRETDVFQNMVGYGLFTGGLGLHYGAETLGTLVIPSGPGNSKRQVHLLREFDTTVVHAIPSYMLYLGRVTEELGMDPRKDLSLRIALLGAEPHSDAARRRIEDIFGLEAFNSYGLSEMNGPGVAFECPYKSGLHLWEDSFLAEIVDPETLRPVPHGSHGELVLTTLDREGMPLIRYRTKDLTRFVSGRCPCGRQHVRIERISGRTDDMIILKGVNIFPLQVEKVLLEIPEAGSNYQIILETRKDGRDAMRLQIEVDGEHFREDVAFLKGLQKKISLEVRGEILVTPEVELVEPNSLPRSKGKAIRVVDNRVA
jgi:phenylacetate-CoA ligase